MKGAPLGPCGVSGNGGHGGYAYLDGFGEAPPVIPEPCTLLLLSLALPAIGLKLRKR